MQIGKNRHRILIRNAPSDATRDTFGRRKGTGTTVCTVWAEKQDWQGTEQTQEGREVAVVNTKWKIRYRTDLKPAMEIVFNSNVYRITSILDFDGRKRELIVTSEQVVP